jgi:hypothetical protein
MVADRAWMAIKFKDPSKRKAWTIFVPGCEIIDAKELFRFFSTLNLREYSDPEKRRVVVSGCENSITRLRCPNRIRGLGRRKPGPPKLELVDNTNFPKLTPAG